MLNKTHKHWAVFLLSFIGASACFSTIATSDEIIIGFDVFSPPFVIAEESSPDGKMIYTGIEVEIIRQSLQVSGHTSKIRVAPLKRRTVEILDGRIDGVATVQKGQIPELYYTNDYHGYQNFAISLAKNDVILKTMADLSKYSISTWSGAKGNLGPEFTSFVEQSPAYTERVNQQGQVAMMLYGRVDVTVIDKSIFQYWAKIENADMSSFRYAALFGGKTNYKVGFKSQQIRDDFDQGLAAIKANGIYQGIYRKFGVTRIPSS